MSKVCVKCGDTRTFIYKTIQYDSLVERYRECRCCGCKYISYEKQFDFKIVDPELGRNGTKFI